jgi:UDPglucose 6-dehydrogenase
MKIIVLGTGYVGLVSGVCFADLGIKVVCIDQNRKKIDQLNGHIMPIYEPGLEELVKKNMLNGNISFDYELAPHINDADAILLAVGTPSIEGSKEVDLSYVMGAVAEITKLATKPMAIIIKSTVPVGTNKKLSSLLEKTGCYVVSNPEFLREGFAIDDFLNPDRVIIGINQPQAQDIMQRLYKNFIDRNVPVIFTSPASAELTKYASNAFLATKIGFINEISDLCEKLGADIEEVSKGMGLDSRIGAKFLKTGPGFGGSCFPKDIAALSDLFETNQLKNPIIDRVIESNAARQISLAEKIAQILANDTSKVITCFGVAFKNNTDDVRESPAIAIIRKLVEMGFAVKIYDPEANDNAKDILTPSDKISYFDDANEASKDSDALVILTEWDSFKELDYNKMTVPVIIDYRNLLSKSQIRDNCKYYRLGSGY